MASSTTRPRVQSVEQVRQVDLAFIAFSVLRVGFVVLPIAVGVDKFFDWMVDWRQYLWSGIPNHLHVSATTLMHAAGVFEIIAGLVVLIAPQLGGAMVAPWLGGIVIDLLLVGHDEHAYWDIALRDFGLMLAAVALVALATHYHPTVRPAYAARTVAERASL